MTKPATSSDSASGRSNGVRLPSASAEMKKMKKATKVNGLQKMNQFCGAHPCCPDDPLQAQSVPVISTTGKIDSPAGIS